MSPEGRPPYPPRPEHRTSGRVRCDVSVRVVSPATWPRARVLDISRTGIRLAVDVGAGGGDSLASLARVLDQPRAVKVVVELDPEHLGSLVRRSLKIVRVSPQRSDEGLLELGCELVPALTEDDAEALGLPLPRPGEPPDVARRRMAAEAPRVRRPNAGARPASPVASDDAAWRAASRVPSPGHGSRAPMRLTATILSRTRAPAGALQGRPLEFSSEGGVLCLEDRSGEPLFRPEASLTDRVVAFSKAYGAIVDVLVDDERGDSVWYGPVRVLTVGDIPEVPGRLIVSFAFRRPLEAWERETLGVLDTADV